uniref:deleted in malignant brain tumors 1 protein isoform X1 n=1 Tax=Ciona intestinalis TaxID=7719 RepID=UPI000180D1D1|nr:deleted in malignant brain tumors 1 protein isoform X1 [Ciona intestinalis]|eukprot:XP_002131777.1 deleted in malignant brain tumors 1 protein isoform X1 [Ciona intestinalis]
MNWLSSTLIFVGLVYYQLADGQTYTCSRPSRLIATNQTQLLKSPGRSSNINYPNNLRCIWNITAPPGMLVRFTVQTLRTERCCDYLQVRWDNSVVRLRDRRSNITFVSNAINLFFRTDGSVRLWGFVANYIIVNSTVGSYTTPPTTTVAPCGFSANATNFSRPLNSPGYPRSYGNYLNCNWYLTARPGYFVQFILVRLTTERCCDRLRVYGSFPYMRQFAGYVTRSTTVVSVNNTMRLYFRSDGSVTRSGFRGYFRETSVAMTTPAPTTTTPPTTPVPCGGNLTATNVSQDFYTPGWSSRYRNNLRCYWYIYARPGWQVHIQVVSVDTESCCDRLRITAPGQTYTINGRSSVIRNYISPANRFTLYFRTDSSVTRRGIYLRYQETRNNQIPTTPTIPPTTPEPCGTNYEVLSSEQPLRSPNYPNPYLSSRVCVWILTAPQNSKIKLRLSSFSTENCCDILDITNVLNRRVVELGGNLSSTVYYSSTNMMTLTFRTDDNNNMQGFEFFFSIATGPIPTQRPAVAPTNGNNQQVQLATTSKARILHPVNTGLVFAVAFSIYSLLL